MVDCINFFKCESEIQNSLPVYRLKKPPASSLEFVQLFDKPNRNMLTRVQC